MTKHSTAQPCDRRGFLGGSDDKESACNAGDLSLIPGSGRSPEEGKGTFPWTEETGGLQSLGSQRVGQLSNCHFLKHSFTCFYFWLCSAVVALRELRSSCGVWASRGGGFPCCGAQALGLHGLRSCGSRARAHRLSSCGTRA